MRGLMTRLLRTRLAADFALLTLVLVVTGAVLLYQWYNTHIREDLDAKLGIALQSLALSCLVGSEGPEVMLPAETQSHAVPPDGAPLWLLIRRRDGTVFYRSSEVIPMPELPMLEGGEGGPTFGDLTLPDGHSVRLAGHWISPPLKPGAILPGPEFRDVHLAAAISQRPLEAHLVDVRHMLVAASVVVLIVLTGLASWLVYRALRPLQALSREISRFPVGSASRFTAPRQAAELEPVVDRLNNLMERVSRTLARERSFAMGAAHELRTPLAGLRARIELALSRPRTAEEYRAELQEALDIERGLESMVSHLLLLARLDQDNHERFINKPIQVGRLLRQCWGEFFDRAEARRLRVGIRVPDRGPELSSSEDLLRLVVRNLFDNAVSYTPEGGAIDISAVHSGTGWEIAVSNTNPGLREHDLPQLAEPFWRARHEEAASDGRHAGLGLALCLRIAQELGGSLSHSLIGEDTVSARLVLPDHPPARSGQGSG